MKVVLFVNFVSMKNLHNFASIFLKVFFFTFLFPETFFKAFTRLMTIFWGVTYVCQMLIFSGYWISAAPKYFLCFFNKNQIHIVSLGPKCILKIFPISCSMETNRKSRYKWEIFCICKSSSTTRLSFLSWLETVW